jgi:hypothetical protein
MTSAELRRAIEEPARAVGLKFDEGIVEDLVREVVNDPAALPLLQFTLTQWWQRRRRNRITREAYAEIGRPAEALGRTAEHVFENLRTEQAQAAARDIFLALVVPAVGAEFVRRRVRRETLHALRDSTQIDRVLDAFVAAGLIRQTPGIEAGDDRFDVMHEALLRNWPRLIAWLKEVREKDSRKLLVLNRARIWEQSGREPDHLAVGATIAETAEFAATDPLILEYVEASRAQAQAQQKRSRIRKAAVATVIAALLAVAIVTNVMGYWQQEDFKNLVQEQKAEIEGQQDVANRLSGENPLLSSSVVPASVNTDSGPGVIGWIRIGQAQQSFLRSAGTQLVVAPADVRADGLYRLRIDVPLVDVPMSGDRVTGPARRIGNASAGAPILPLGTVTFTDRPAGRQYWLRARVIPRVYVQYSGGSGQEIDLILEGLRSRGFDVPPAQQLAAPRGKAEIRYHYPQDAHLAASLAAAVGETLALHIPNPPPVSMRRITHDLDKAHQGYLEVWIDLSPVRP